MPERQGSFFIFPLDKGGLGGFSFFFMQKNIFKYWNLSLEAFNTKKKRNFTNLLKFIIYQKQKLKDKRKY
jgi:hypothetical protein